MFQYQSSLLYLPYLGFDRVIYYDVVILKVSVFNMFNENQLNAVTVVSESACDLFLIYVNA